MTEEKAAGMWAIIEIFGHQRIAGFMTEQVIAGQGFVRVDVPELLGTNEDQPIAAHSKLYGPGSIYAISPVDETLARLAAQQIRHVPVQSYGLREALKNMPEEHRARLLQGPDHDGLGDDT